MYEPRFELVEWGVIEVAGERVITTIFMEESLTALYTRALQVVLAWPDGRKTVEQFGGGWRTHPVNARFEPFGGHEGMTMIVVDCSSVVNVKRQFYSIDSSGCVVLIRLESLSGRHVRNDYTRVNARVGPAMPSLTADECRRRLASGHPSDVLSCLVWLGGEHQTEPVPKGYEHSLEDGAVGTRVREILSDVHVLEQLRALTESSCEWVAEAARACLAAAAR